MSDELIGDQTSVIRETTSTVSVTNASNEDLPNEGWFKSYWRPACAWVFLFIILLDYAFFPLMAMIFPIIYKLFGLGIVAYVPWSSITSSSGGMFFVSMGSIVTMNSFSRMKEKLSLNG